MTRSRLLGEQLTYYRERAAEYDEWWERRGRYDRGPELNDRWRREISIVRAIFDDVPLGNEVVELAAGTGYWTELLARRGVALTVLDGAPEMIAINRTRLGDLVSGVDYRQTDLFEWRPPRRWDGLVACFWISHVPRDRLRSFFRTCRMALKDGGVMFLLDGLRAQESTALDHALPERGGEVAERRLNDGREFRIVKNFYEPRELTEGAEAAGLDLNVGRTDTFFQFAVGRCRAE